jgi:transposase InsO family protein
MGKKVYRLIQGGYGVEKNLPLRFTIPIIGLSAPAKQRLRWFDHYYAHECRAALTCRYFGISRKTFYKWLKRYDRYNLYKLQDRSRRPKKARSSMLFIKYRERVKLIRRQHPTWSKYKIGATLRQNNMDISDSSAGYILKKLGMYDKKIARKRKQAIRRERYKIRIRDVDIKFRKPGDLVQMDTKEYVMCYGEKFYQYTAIDCVSRKRKLIGYSTKTAKNAELFLDKVILAFPFKIRAIVTDNGSEFKKEFDLACNTKKIPHYWTDPDTPNQNAYVESSHRIDQKEFYDIRYIPEDIDGFNEALAEWEHEYNSIRPHGSIAFLSPNNYLKSVKITSS